MPEFKDKKRKNFLETLKIPTEKEVGGPIDYSNVVISARMQARDFNRQNELAREKEEKEH